MNPQPEQIKAHFLTIVAESIRMHRIPNENSIHKLPGKRVSISTRNPFQLRGVEIGNARFIYSHDQIVAAGIKLKVLYGLIEGDSQTGLF